MAYLKMATAKPAANTLTTLYTVGAVTGTASILVCNTSPSDSYVNIAISATATPTADEYIAYNFLIPANGIHEFKDVILAATENIVVISNTANITYRLHGNLA